MRQATELLDWIEEPSQGLDDSNPPFYTWFADGRLNASANCLDRHVEAGLGDRVAYHWRGEEGEERDVTYARAARRHAALRQRAARLRDREGRRGRDLPADDPRGRRRDAGLRPDRRAPQRRLRRLLGGVGAGADGVLRGEGAGHRRRGAAQGPDRADQGGGRRAHGRPGDAGDDRRRPPHRDRLPDDGRAATASTTSCWRRPTPSARRSRSTPSTRSTSSTPPARPRSRRGSCTRPAAT